MKLQYATIPTLLFGLILYGCPKKTPEPPQPRYPDLPLDTGLDLPESESGP